MNINNDYIKSEYTMPANLNFSEYRIIEDLRMLVDQNRDLIDEIRMLRKIYPDYDEASDLFRFDN